MTLPLSAPASEAAPALVPGAPSPLHAVWSSIQWRFGTLRGVVLVTLGVVMACGLVLYLRMFQAETLAVQNMLDCGALRCAMEVDRTRVFAPATDTTLQTCVYMANALGEFVDSQSTSTLPDLAVHAPLYQRQGWHNRLTVGLVCSAAVDPKTWVVLFRGSQTVSDLLVDVKMNQSPAPHNPYGTQPLVHSGFLQAYYGLRRDLLAALPLGTPLCQRIIFAGHSMGACVAALAALDISQAYADLPVDVFAFGSPAMGNADMADLLDRSGRMRLRRVVNTCDIVPTLPRPVTANIVVPYQPLLYVQSAASLYLVFAENRASVTKNHYHSTYVRFLNRIADAAAPTASAGTPFEKTNNADASSLHSPALPLPQQTFRIWE